MFYAVFEPMLHCPTMGESPAKNAPPDPTAVEPAPLSFTLNNRRVRVLARPHDVLLDVIRERIGLTGSKRGCDMGTCGCCAVEVNGVVVLSCLTLAHEVRGADVRTIEGLRDGAKLHPLQEAYEEHGASQCGFCSPGFLITAANLLDRNPDPSESEIREAISGGVCRCTGYVKIVEAIKDAAARLRDQRGADCETEPASRPGGALPGSEIPGGETPADESDKTVGAEALS